MEDSHIAHIDGLDNNLALFGVFDGHGGKFKQKFMKYSVLINKF